MEILEPEVVEPEVIEAEAVNEAGEETEKVVNSEVMSLAVMRFDEADALAIEEMLKGVVTDKFVYRFKAKDGSEVKGLSVLGVRSAVHYLNSVKGFGIRIEDNLRIEYREIGGETYVIAVVSAIDGQGNRWFGAAQQPINMRRKDGVSVPDPFAVAKAVSKAQRNALRGLFPEPIVVELMELWTKEGKVVELTEEESEPIQATVTENQATDTPTEQPVNQPEKPKVQITDDRQLWRQIYRVARDIYGNDFKTHLLRIIKERYDVDRLELPTDALQDLLTYLEAERAALKS